MQQQIREGKCIKRYGEEGGDDDANKQQQQEENVGESLIFNILKLKQLWITQLDGWGISEGEVMTERGPPRPLVSAAKQEIKTFKIKSPSANRVPTLDGTLYNIKWYAVWWMRGTTQRTPEVLQRNPIWANIQHAIIEFTIIPLIAMQLASLCPMGCFFIALCRCLSIYSLFPPPSRIVEIKVSLNWCG